MRVRRSDSSEPCRILRIEEDGPRRRYICSCGCEGWWCQDGWRHGTSGARRYTAEQLIQWNWHAHAGIVAHYRKRRAAIAKHAATVRPYGTRLFVWRCACGKTSRSPTSRWRADRNAKAHRRAGGQP